LDPLHPELAHLVAAAEDDLLFEVGSSKTSACAGYSDRDNVAAITMRISVVESKLRLCTGSLVPGEPQPRAL
jgi:hypothetical protein